MDLKLEGKRALVTGGSLGIGRAIARELAAEGVAVAINARNADRLASVAAEIAKATGGRVVAVAGDLERPDEPERVVGEARRALGGIDILVNNAGASPAGRLQDLSDDDWRHCIDLKLMGYVRCARAATPEMAERRWGRVVNVNGRSGHQPRAWYMSGGAVNAAILNFTKALAEEMAPFNVLVNAVNPGPIQTPRWDSHMQQGAATLDASEDDVRKRMIESIPLGRVGTPEECSGVVAFLCSERASFIHGSFINVDGGGTRCI
jgi:3-oxoacyl-[acyl-carrier protein] reductase